MEKIYPLKFFPFFMEKPWGGMRIKTDLGIDYGKLKNCGEAWMLSGVEAYDSVVANGFLEGNTLSEMIEIYMGDLLGEKVFDAFGLQFPLLFKWIDANEDLSVQVHPNDEMAMKEHQCMGKNEMWYVQKAEPAAQMILGLKKGVKKIELADAIEEGRIKELLNSKEVNKGDVYYIKSGSVHAIGKGILLAEIQQASDITYRMYDWDRKDKEGNARDLHIGESLKAIDFQDQQIEETLYTKVEDVSNAVLSSPNFTCNFLRIKNGIEKEIGELDSFIVYMCVSGKGLLRADDHVLELCVGELVLVPACVCKLLFYAESNDFVLLETYIENI